MLASADIEQTFLNVGIAGACAVALFGITVYLAKLLLAGQQKTLDRTDEANTRESDRWTDDRKAIIEAQDGERASWARERAELMAANERSRIREQAATDDLRRLEVAFRERFVDTLGNVARTLTDALDAMRKANRGD